MWGDSWKDAEKNPVTIKGTLNRYQVISGWVKTGKQGTESIFTVKLGHA